jgi:hypothetical protein
VQILLRESGRKRQYSTLKEDNMELDQRNASSKSVDWSVLAPDRNCGVILCIRCQLFNRSCKFFSG